MLFRSELWIGGKPQRKKMSDPDWTPAEKASADINKFNGQRKVPQHFWACVVWNYATNSIELLNITQGKVQQDLLALAKNPKWGSLDKYDINIVRGKTGQQVTYTVQPEPPTELSAVIKDKLANTTIDMEKYFAGGHPIEFGQGAKDKVNVPDESDIDDLINE